MGRYSILVLFVAGALLCGRNVCYAQHDLRFEHFTSENGLSENVVYAIFQDSKGYLWVGTHDGLNRYNGYTFKKFRHNPADSNSLTDNTINCICEDSKGNIWLATNAGLCRYDPQTGKFGKTTLELQSNSVNVQQVLPANEDELIVKHDFHFSLINLHTLKQTAIYYNYNGEKKNYLGFVTPLTKDKKGNIYAATKSNESVTVWQYDNSSKSFIESITFSVDRRSTNSISFCYIDSHKRCWITINGAKPIILNLSKKISKDVKIKSEDGPGQLTWIYEDKEGYVWSGTNEGLFCYNNGAELVGIYRNNNLPSSISFDFIQTICQDKTGIIWIGTSNGLNKLNPLQRKFKHITTDTRPDLFNNFVLGIYPESNKSVRIHYNIWKAYFSRLNFHDASVRHFSIKDYDYEDYLNEVKIINSSQIPHSLSDKIISFLRSMPSGSGKPNGFLLVDSSKNYWYIDAGLLIQVSTLQRWEMGSLIADARIYNNEIWIATNGNGLICFNISDQKITNHISKASKINSINSNDITCFLFENNGNLWIGTKGGGLNYSDRQKNIFQQYTEQDGLCNNSIYCMVKDDRNRIWIGTSYGLSCFDPSIKRFKNYFRKDGLINSEFNRYSACKLPDGTIMMGGMHGIDYFHPDSLTGRSKPDVLITDFKVLDKNIYEDQNLSLSHNRNNITIEFAATDYTNPAGNKFSYKLEGADNNWMDAGYRNFANYSLLPPGKYRFLVKAANSDGVWSEQPAVFSFTILSPWYQTWWFYGLCIAAVAAFVYILFKYRLKQQLLVLHIRNRLHRDLHDDVGATLSSVKAYSEILKDNPDNPFIADLIKENSSEMIERLEVIAWATNPQHDNFKSLQNIMIKFARPLCLSRKIDFHFEKDGIDEQLIIPGDVRQNIYLVFKESINNMIKYADATACNVNMFIKNQKFILQVKDNGIGHNEDVQGNGSGLKNMKRRAEEMGGSIERETGHQKGMLVKLSIPYPFKIPNSWDRNLHNK